jgi:hypothetical protein
MANTAANVLVGTCTVTVGSAASGYTTEDGVTITISDDEQEVMVDQSVYALKQAISKRGCEIAFTFAEASLVNMALVLPGATVSPGTVLTLNEPGDTLTPSTLTLVGKDQAGTARTWLFGSVVPTGGTSYTYGKAKLQEVPAKFKAIKSASGTVPLTITDVA